MNKQAVYKTIFLLLIVAVVFLGFKVTDQQEKLNSIESDKAEIESLLSGADGVLGYSCGVLNLNRAEDILESTGLKMDFEQGPTDTVRDTKAKQENIFWNDSCRYELANNNNKYVEMYVATFQDDLSAEKAFPDFIQIVNEAKEINNQQYGQQLFYDSGVFYLLKDNKVIQVAASNGLPQQLELFSEKVFESILTSL